MLNFSFHILPSIPLLNHFFLLFFSLNMTKSGLFEQMARDGKVTLVRSGTLSKVRRKAPKGRNPQTGEAIKIKASNTVKFKPGKKPKNAI